MQPVRKQAETSYSFSTSFFGLPAILAILIFILDQITKLFVLKNWQTPGKIYIEVIEGFFSLVHFQNTGAAWGIMADKTQLLGLISLGALLAIIIFFKYLTESLLLPSIAYGILLGGIAGNLYDRLFRGFVVDFLFFYYKDYEHSWPAFNIADAAISCSVAVLLIYSLFFYKNTKGQDKIDTDL